jgi:tetratricopeptide (TPR) repeat protein
MNENMHLKQAINFYKAKKFREALSACERAIRDDPSCSRAYHGKGLALFAIKRLKEALDCYNQAIKLDSSNVKAYISRGDLFSEKGITEQAILDYDRAIWLGAEEYERSLKQGEAKESINFKFRLNKSCHTDRKAYSLQEERMIKLRRGVDMDVRKSSHTVLRF